MHYLKVTILGKYSFVGLLRQDQTARSVQSDLDLHCLQKCLELPFVSQLYDGIKNVICPDVDN